MNGCELPCGSIIKVQPAKSEKDKSVSVVATREDSLTSQKEAEVPKDDGLDDFFASL